jgi:opacity protein-like surface antigen
MPKFLLFVILIFVSFSIQAQTWEFGGAVGGAGYMGSLNINDPVKISGPSVSGFFQRNFDEYLSLKLQLSYGIISAADSNSSNAQFRQRNLSFTTPITEVSVLGEFNFMKYIPSVTNNRYTPYIFFGFAALNYSPSTIYEGKKYELRDLETEGEKKPYATTAFAFPYGAGIKYNIFSSLTLGGEIGYRNPNTNYLDDVSGYYANMSNASPIAKALADRSGEKTGIYIGSPGTQRGDLESRDTYFFTQVTISYTFISQKCYFHN